MSLHDHLRPPLQQNQPNDTFTDAVNGIITVHSQVPAARQDRLNKIILGQKRVQPGSAEVPGNQGKGIGSTAKHLNGAGAFIQLNRLETQAQTQVYQPSPQKHLPLDFEDTSAKKNETPKGEAPIPWPGNRYEDYEAASMIQGSLQHPTGTARDYPQFKQEMVDPTLVLNGASSLQKLDPPGAPVTTWSWSKIFNLSGLVIIMIVVSIALFGGIRAVFS